MTSPVKQALSSAVLALLRPLVRILLRNGVAYGMFAELAKKAYADVAFEEFAIAGRKQTISRVSVLTGLTRKEAKRLLELDRLDAQGADERYNRAIRVISGWVNDPGFHDATGRPATLALDGGPGTFARLVRRYSGDMPTQAMLQALTAAGSVAREGDRVRLVRHAYIPGGDPVDKIHILGTDTAELVSTIDHNLAAGDGEPWLQRKVSNAHVDARALADFRRMSAEKAQQLLEELDRWLGEHEEARDPDAAPGRYVSLGIYYFESDDSEENES
ncbi:MAG TPA: DUF6502 family protein [Gammaproteobacteria bacterium]|nr:DUF6502 family protein [Gammaproteobacteria bacterium]